jgi:hypothetical protein
VNNWHFFDAKKNTNFFFACGGQCRNVHLAPFGKQKLKNSKKKKTIPHDCKHKISDKRISGKYVI